MRSLVIIIAITLLAGTAHAGERFEIIDRDTEVEVIVSGATAATNAKVEVVRERIEIPLASAASNSKRVSEDATVRLAEVRGRSERKLSLKLRHDHDRVVDLASGVSYVQVGDTVHVTIPRQPKPVPAVAVAPIDETRPAAVAPVTAPAPIPAPIAETKPAPAAIATPFVETRPAPAGVTKPATAPAIGNTDKRATSTRWWMLLGGLILVSGGLVVILRKRRNAAPAINELEIIATRSLGGKARIVWIAAGDRELVLGVSGTSISALGQWRRAAPPAVGRGFDRDLAAADRDLAERNLTEIPSLARASSSSTEMPTIARGSSSQIPSIPKAGPGVFRAGTSSPAISGLLRLRSNMATLNDDVSTEDAEEDAQWNRDVLDAGGRR